MRMSEASSAVSMLGDEPQAGRAGQGTTMQALLEEAINDLLVKKGRTKLVQA